MDLVEIGVLGFDSVWFIIGACLVFFMQAGFAMVETGFTRAKNAGNIIMKNTMDFSVGTVAFLFLGYALMCGTDVNGIIGALDFSQLASFTEFDWPNFFFQLVFCATTATIVSGSMAERTKFSAYIIYSLFISALIYPIEAHWVWGGGWLAQLGYFDWAGSTVIHMVGGTIALVGAMLLGPRIGKYNENGKPNAIAGHSITLGCLGVFILWFGWYGFNGAAGGSIGQVSQIFVTTTIAAAVAACAAMLFTWAKDGKPDVSMTLNAALAGLVGITAPCAVVDALGATAIGLICGLIVVLSVTFIDRIRIDDPVGAVSVHGVCGLIGGLSVGLFANPAIIDANAVGIGAGLFYGGGFAQLGIQALGAVVILAWSVACALILFGIIKKTVGLRVSKEEELEGLDIAEHGLLSAYADFVPTLPAIASEGGAAADLTGLVPVKLNTIAADSPMTKISILCNPEQFLTLKDTMAEIGVAGMTVSSVMGCGVQHGKTGQYRGVHTKMNLLPKLQVDIVVSEIDPGLVAAAAQRALYTGNPGDGKIFITPVGDTMRVSSGETGKSALDYAAKG